jgi:hypothetical protein
VDIDGFVLFAAAVVVLVVVGLLMGVRQAPQGYAYTVEWFGKYYKRLYPGLGLIAPWMDPSRCESSWSRSIDPITVRTLVADLPAGAHVRIVGIADASILEVVAQD